MLKKFIIKTFCVILFIIITLSVLEVLARRVPNDYSVKNSLLEKNSDRLRTIVLGNSQAYFGIDPQFFKEKAFNAAHVSEPLNIDAFILNKFLPQMDSLKNIIISISSFTPFSYWEPGGQGECWRIKHYHLYYGYPTAIYDFANNLELFNLNYPNDLRWAEAIMGKSLTYTDSLGFGHDYVKFHAPDWEKCRSAVEIHKIKNYINHPNIQRNKDIITSMAETNKDKNIYLLFFPVWHTYSELMDKGQIDVVKNFCKDITLLHKNVKFLDYYEDKRFGADDFADAYHLSEKGAMKLTLLLDSIISR